MPLLYGNDERAHLAYVEYLVHGDLPTVDSPIRAGSGFELLDEQSPGRDNAGARNDVWVANHPPLAHALITLPVLGLRQANVMGGVGMLPRMMSALAMAIGVAATASVADALRPGCPMRGALVAMLAGLTPMTVSVAGLGQIDGAGFAAGTVLLAVVLRTVRGGPNPTRLCALALMGGLAALTRVSLLPLVGLAAIAWVLTARRRPVNAAIGGLLILTVPAATAGWFYARNVDLYGDVAGSGHLQEKFDRAGSGGTLELLGRPRLWAGIWQEMWGSFDFGRIGTGWIRVGSSEPHLGTRLVIGGVLAGLAAFGGLRHRVRRPLPRNRSDILVWGIALTWLFTCVVGVASFASGGGTPHPRYLLPAHAVVASLIVAGVSAALPSKAAWRVVIVGLVGIDLLLLILLRDAVGQAVTPSALMLPGWIALIVALAVVGALVSAAAVLHLSDGPSPTSHASAPSAVSRYP
jgi:hypothetical protein